MAENVALKGRVADLERELEEALCKLKLGSASPGPAKVVTLALRSEKQKKPDLVFQRVCDRCLDFLVPQTMLDEDGDESVTTPLPPFVTLSRKNYSTG